MQTLPFLHHLFLLNLLQPPPPQLLLQILSHNSQHSLPVTHLQLRLTSENKNTYTISSGSTRINNFVTIYTITGGINYIKSSSDLIVSTIIKDFDSNANIAYVKNDLSSQTNTVQQQQKQQLPNPFVDKSVINQAISNAVNNIISSTSISYGGYLQIKCAFGMNLADYQCNSVPFTS